MFKRANKITSLLVAAAAVASMVPAYAADVKKVDSEDGTVYGAVAYKDGTALIDGEVNDTDAAYYYKDGKYTELDNVDSGADYAAYGSKYAKVDDGSDYNVDLGTGKVLDQDLPSDDEDDAASALRKEIKDSDRYKDATVGAVYGDQGIADLTIIKGNKFAEDTWYSTVYGVESGEFATGNTATSTNVYTDGKGNYIDADYNVGKIKVEATGTSVNIENTKDLYEVVSGSKTAYASISNANVLGQDKDNIYRYVTLTINVPGATGSIKINNKSFALSSNKVDLDVIQKISKAQDSDDVDDGKYAKTVTNYVVSDDDATLGSDAAKYLALAKDSAVEGKVINGKLALYKVTNTSSADNVAVQAATLKNKNGYYYTDVESQTTIQAEYSSDLSKVAVDTDVDGNIYVLDGGYVKEFDGTDDWNKVYKVDGSFDSLSVYDKNDMVAWSQGDEVYSVIGDKKADDTKTDDTTTTTPAVAKGWVKAADGTWSYNKADGTKATGWLQDGAWYYLNANGVMATGWVNAGGTWYYLNASGAMQTGWINDNGTWYYCNASGAMLASTTVDGYVLGANGAWVK